MGGRIGHEEEALTLCLSQELPALWESVLPPELFQMGEGSVEVGKMPGEERFFAPFREGFYKRVGRC